MNFLFAPAYIPGNLIQAVCRTLVHSLWQGLLAAAAAGIIIAATKRSKAAVRYNLLSFVFTGFIAVAVITFFIQAGILFTPATGTAVVQFIPDNRTPVTAITENNWLPSFNKENVYQSAIHYADKYAPVITGIWLLFFCIHLFRMLTGLHYAHRIRNCQILEPANEWKQRLKEMIRLLGIREVVSLLESGIVKVPVVTGFVKPVILVPLGMLSNLSPQQVESILLHELAHVRRRDFLANLLQRLAESFFFFNPFILWISGRIREERENCCDDIVLQHTTDKRSYLEALISFREADAGTYSYAMSLGRNNKLLYRVRRMITQENKKLNAMEKFTLILVLTAATALSFMPARKEGGIKHDRDGQQSLILSQQQEQLPVSSFIVNNNLQEPAVSRDTLPRSERITFSNISSVNNDDGENRSSVVTAKGSNGKTYSYRLENDQIIELSIDGKKIKEEDFSEYRPLIDQIEIIREERIKKAFFKQQMDAGIQLQKQELLNKQLLELSNLKQMDLADENKALVLKKMMAEDALNKQVAGQDRNNILKQRLADKLALEQDRNNIMNLELKEKLTLQDKQHQELLNQKLILQNKQEQASMNLLQLKLKNELLTAQDLRFHDSNHQLASIIAELAEAGVVKNKENFSFTLNDKELVVDGKKQPAELHERLRKTYIRHKDDYYKFKAKGKSRSTDIYVE